MFELKNKEKDMLKKEVDKSNELYKYLTFIENDYRNNGYKLDYSYTTMVMDYIHGKVCFGDHSYFDPERSYYVFLIETLLSELKKEQ